MAWFRRYTFFARDSHKGFYNQGLQLILFVEKILQF